MNHITLQVHLQYKDLENNNTCVIQSKSENSKNESMPLETRLVNASLIKYKELFNFIYLKYSVTRMYNK